MPDTNQYEGKVKEKVSTQIFKSRLFWIVIAMIGISPCVIFTVFLGYQYIFQLPKAKEAQAHLEIEFKTIAPLPNAKIVESLSLTKTNNAFVETTYLTDVDFTDIFNYYDGQLRQHGWQLKSTHGLGRKVADYCKGDYAAELAFTGQKANNGGTYYAFNMSWGLDDCK
jgi:hypothetical protein